MPLAPPHYGKWHFSRHALCKCVSPRDIMPDHTHRPVNFACSEAVAFVFAGQIRGGCVVRRRSMSRLCAAQINPSVTCGSRS